MSESDDEVVLYESSDEDLAAQLPSRDSYTRKSAVLPTSAILPSRVSAGQGNSKMQCIGQGHPAIIPNDATAGLAGLQNIPAHILMLIAVGGPSCSLVSSIKVRPIMPDKWCWGCFPPAIDKLRSPQRAARVFPHDLELCPQTIAGLVARSRVHLLSCCTQFWQLEVPIRLGAPLFHQRYHPAPRFRIVEIKLGGDAVDSAQLATVGAYAEGLISISFSLCRRLDSLTPILACRFVCRVELRECHKLWDLSPLAKCVCLKDIEIVQCFKAVDLLPLQKCRRLKSLLIADNPYMRNIDPVFGCKELKSLEISGCSALDDKYEKDLERTYAQLVKLAVASAEPAGDVCLTWNGVVAGADNYR